MQLHVTCLRVRSSMKAEPIVRAMVREPPSRPLLVCVHVYVYLAVHTVTTLTAELTDRQT